MLRFINMLDKAVATINILKNCRAGAEKISYFTTETLIYLKITNASLP